MKFNSLSRRFFLQGAAGALVLPVLPSLLSGRAYADAAASSPVRFLQVFSSYGPSAPLFYGTLTANQRVSPNVNVRALSGISGALSPMIGADFNALRSKFSVLRGLDVFSVSNGHNRVFASCASSYAKGLDGDRYPPITGQVSADTLMANSTKVYASTVPVARRQIVLAPSAADNYSRSSF